MTRSLLLILNLALLLTGCSNPLGGGKSMIDNGRVSMSISLSVSSGSAQSGTAGTALSMPLIAIVRNSSGAAIQDVAVTWTVATGGGSLSACTTVTDPSGLVQCNWTLGNIVGAQSVTASISSSQTSASFTATATAGAASRLAFSTSPAGTNTAATFFTQSPVVLIQDASGNTITTSNASVTLAIGTNAGAGALSGTATVAAVNGVATFPNLSINKSGTGYTLTAASSGLTGATSNPFNINAGTATQLAFQTQPVGGLAGTAFAHQPIVLIQDVNGNTVTASSASVTLAIANNLGAGTLSGTATISSAGGIASFGGLSINKSGNGYTLTATSSGLTSVTSDAFNIVTASASQVLVAAGNGHSANAGSNLSQPLQAIVQDAFGNPVGAGTTVTWAAASGGGSVASCAASSTNISGVASCTPTLSVSAGANIFTASVAGITTPASFSATATAGTAALVTVLANNNQTTSVNYSLPSALVVQVTDSNSNPVGAGVSVAWSVQSGGGSVSTCAGSVTNLSGQASCTPQLGTATGTNTFRATVAASQANFSALAQPGTPNAILVYANDNQNGVAGANPAFPLTAIVTDSFSNPVAAGVAVTWTAASGGGSVSGCASTVTNASGLATCTPTLGVSAGVNTFTASSAGVSGPATFSATGTAGAASSIAISANNNQSAAVGAALASSLQVILRDANNNPVGSGVAVTWSVLTGSGSVAACAASVTNSSSIASCAPTLGTATGSNTFSASASGAGDVTFTATANPGEINNFLLSSVPSSASAGSSFSFTLTARDSYNNVKTDYVGAVAFTSSDSNAPTLPANYTYLVSDLGVRQFSFTLNTSGNQTITATQVSGGTPTVATPNIAVIAAPVSQLLFITGPTNTQAGSPIATMLVRAIDAYGNTATSYTGTVTLAIGTNPNAGTLAGTVSGNAIAGSISFPGLSINRAGIGYTLTASGTGGVTSDTSTAFSVNVGAASQILLSSGNNQTTIAGQPLAQALVALVTDSLGNPVPAATVVWSTNSGALGSVASATNVSGLASNTLTTQTTASAVTVTATIQGTATSVNFGATGTHGPASQIVYTTQPTGGVAESVNLPTQPVLSIRDVNNNTVTTGVDATAGVTLSLTSGTGALGGTLTVPAIAGIATFSGISVDTQGAGKVITATKAGTLLSGGTASKTVASNLFLINPPPPSAFTISSVTPRALSAVVAWGASTNSTSYDILYDTVSRIGGGSYASSMNGVSSGATVSALSTGTTYYFRVRANGISGSVLSTNEISSAVHQAFSLNIPFTGGTGPSYAISDSSRVELLGGVARLTQADQTDDSSGTGFQNGTLAGVQWDASNGHVRLNTTTNNAELDSSWTPQWSNLVGYWKLNGNGIDSSIYLNNAALSGNVTFTTINKIGSYGALFDGTSAHLTIPNSPELENIQENAFTILAWAKITSSLNNAWVVAKNGFHEGIFFEFSGAKYRIGCVIFSTNGVDVSVYTGYNYPINELHHVACTMDKTASFTRLYVDGKLTTQKTNAASATLRDMGTTPWRIGSPNGSSSFFTGLIDEVAMFNSGLTSSEIATIYDRQSAKYSGLLTSRVLDAYSSQPWTTLSSTTSLPFYKELPGSAGSESSTNYSSLGGGLMNGLVGLWRLDESSGTTYFDSSGSGYNGTLSGSAAVETAGKFSNAVTQTAGGGRITVPTSAMNFSGTASFSVSAWMKTTASTPGTYFDIITARGTDANGQQGWIVYVDGNTGRIVFRRTVNSIETGPNSVLINDGLWHHFVATYDGTQSRLWVDGKYIAGRVDSSSMLPVASSLRFMGSGATSGSIDEIAVWSRPLTSAEARELYRRGGNRVKYQLRSCSTSNCSDQEALITNYKGWKGPDNTGLSYFSELYNTTNNVLAGTVSTGAPTMTFSNFSGTGLSVSNNRYFQYRAILESDDENNLCNYGAGAVNCSPELKSIAVGPNHYDTTIQTITSNSSIGSAYQTLDVNGFTETLGSNSCASGARYSLSSDGMTFYYWNGSAWATSSAYATANDAATMRANIASFPLSAAGTGSLQVRTYLISNGTSACEVDNLLFTGRSF